MLVLSRRVKESVVIDGQIIVTVIKIRGNQVQLAFQAPKETPIHRREIYEALLAEEQADSADRLSPAAVA